MKTVVLLLTAIIALFVPASFAQKSKQDQGLTRSVQGTVTNPDGSTTAGAVVQLENTKTLQVRTFITTEDGAFHFYELGTDVDYRLKAEDEKSGASSSTKTLSSFNSRKLATINLKLNPKK